MEPRQTAASVAAKASVLLGVRRAEQARELLRAHLAEAPDDAAALRQLARAELALDNPEACLDVTRQASARDPDNELLHRLAALAHARLRNHDAAAAEADHAIKLAPQLWLTHLVRAQIDSTCNWVTLRSEQAARDAVRLAPNAATAHATLGRVLLEGGQLQLAQTSLRAALRLEPGNASALNDLARTQLRRRRYGAAANGFAAAAGRMAGDPAAAMNLLIAAFKMLTLIQAIEFAALAFAFAWHGAAQTRAAPVSTLALQICWLAATTLISAAVFAAKRQAGANARRLVRAVRSTTKILTIWLVIIAACWTALGVAAFVPADKDDVPLALGFWTAVLGLVFRLTVPTVLTRGRQMSH